VSVNECITFRIVLVSAFVAWFFLMWPPSFSFYMPDTAIPDFFFFFSLKVSADKHRPDDMFVLTAPVMDDKEFHMATTWYHCSSLTTACRCVCGEHLEESGDCSCGVKLRCSCKSARKKDCKCALDPAHVCCDFHLKVRWIQLTLG
jgi:hypothetical protein